MGFKNENQFARILSIENGNWQYRRFEAEDKDAWLDLFVDSKKERKGCIWHHYLEDRKLEDKDKCDFRTVDKSLKHLKMVETDLNII